MGYELGLSIKGIGGAKGTSDNFSKKSCPSSNSYSYENGSEVWGAIIFGTSYSFDENANPGVSGLGGGYKFHETCTDPVIADVVSGKCCDK